MVRHGGDRTPDDQGASHLPSSGGTACRHRAEPPGLTPLHTAPAIYRSLRMKICFFGSSLVSSYWNGAATYYRGILKALSALGHEIAFYEPDAFERQSHRDIANPEWAEVVVYPATSEGWQRSLEHAVASADLLVKASGVGVFDRELEVAVAETPTRARRVYWDVDAPATLDEIAANPAHHLRKAIPRYDVVFTYGGGAPV